MNTHNKILLFFSDPNRTDGTEVSSLRVCPHPAEPGVVSFVRIRHPRLIPIAFGLDVNTGLLHEVPWQEFVCFVYFPDVGRSQEGQLQTNLGHASFRVRKICSEANEGVQYGPMVQPILQHYHRTPTNQLPKTSPRLDSRPTHSPLCLCMSRPLP